MRRLPLLTGVVVIGCLASSSDLVSQSPPALTPFRGLVDHVSRSMSGSITGYNDSGPRAISGDGRYVAFSSNVADLVPADGNYWDDVFLRDRTTQTTTRVSVADDGSEADGQSRAASISTNGRHVAFVSAATNLVAGDTNGRADIFVRDLDGNHTVRVSVATDGTQSDGESNQPSISADGRYV